MRRTGRSNQPTVRCKVIILPLARKPIKRPWRSPAVRNQRRARCAGRSPCDHSRCNLTVSSRRLAWSNPIHDPAGSQTIAVGGRHPRFAQPQKTATTPAGVTAPSITRIDSKFPSPIIQSGRTLRIPRINPRQRMLFPCDHKILCRPITKCQTASSDRDVVKRADRHRPSGAAVRSSSL